jgi:hypothetical protein
MLTYVDVCSLAYGVAAHLEEAWRVMTGLSSNAAAQVF